MNPQQSAKTIIETLKAKGVETEVFASMNALAEDLIDAGMELDEIEEGLTVGFNNGWFEMFDDFIAVTRTGEKFYWSSLSTRVLH